MSLDELAYLKHMLDEARYLEGKAAGLGKRAFLADPTLQRAFVRSLEIIGEATKHVPEYLRTRYPSIPWRAMAGMRDRVRQVSHALVRLCNFINCHLFDRRFFRAMPVISYFFGIYIRMYFDDHAPPHFHVEYQG